MKKKSAMSPSDKIKSGTNSKTREGQAQACLNPIKMETGSPDLGSASASTSDATKPGTVASIPIITASPTTLKCSSNDQMKTFDPGDGSGPERLTNNDSSKNPVVSDRLGYSGLMRNGNRNYKAGSKINKLADMLAKRSQSVVEVTQGTADGDQARPAEDRGPTSPGTLLGPNPTEPSPSFNKTGNKSNELELFRKSRRKSVPNQSCSLSSHLHASSLPLSSSSLSSAPTSKSCTDISNLFRTQDDGDRVGPGTADQPELNNALGDSLSSSNNNNKLQTDESTKKKAIRKNLKNIELTLILPEKKRRFSVRTAEHQANGKVVEKPVDVSSKADVPTTGVNGKKSGSPVETVTSSAQSPVHSICSTNLAKENSRTKQRKSKRLVETSTQTADIEFAAVTGTAPAKGVPSNGPECGFCRQSEAFDPARTRTQDKEYGQSRHGRVVVKCQYCTKKVSSADELKSHYAAKHANKAGSRCSRCDTTREDVCQRDQSGDDGVKTEDCVAWTQPEAGKADETQDEAKPERKTGKSSPSKTDLKIDVSFEAGKKSSVSPRSSQRVSPRDATPDEHLLEMEMLFYSHLSGNIQENLTNHLDGKMDQNGHPIRIVREDSDPARAKGNGLLTVVSSASGFPDVQTTRAPSPYKTRSKTPNPLPQTAKKFKKLPNWQQKFWEKYNFPTNYRYEHRFWDKNYSNAEKSALYLKDLSCLDIKTQLTMRENIKRLEDVKSREEKEETAAATRTDHLKFPEYLSLVPARVEGGPRTGPESQETTLGGIPGKRLTRKEREESKRSSRSSGPATELPNAKSRRKLSSETGTPPSGRKQTDKATDSDGGGKMMTRRQSSMDLLKTEDVEEAGRRRKGSLDMTPGQKMTLRGQMSLENLQKKGGESTPEKSDQQQPETAVENVDSDSGPLSPSCFAEISGEWVKPRSYLCGTCCMKFTNLWELEDHKWVTHPNVWCTHYEFEDDKIDKLFRITDDEGGGGSGSGSKEKSTSELSNVKLTDLYKRYLLPHGSLKTAKLVPSMNFPEPCTKCKKSCASSSEMHKHMLDCGGDTTWFLTMYSSPMTIKRKWRPFGSRRRKHLGRRDLKRNIPHTPNFRSYHHQHRIRTKPGDVESIQKMLANLPEKRARRAINFDEIKTRSQATIHSNRLLRKRFKSSFGNNFLKLKALKPRPQLKQGKKDGGSSKSTTDTSSESTPVGSPKRRIRARETMQMFKEESVTTDASTTESSSDSAAGSSGRKRSQTKRGDASPTVATPVPSQPTTKPDKPKKLQKRKVQDRKRAKEDKKPITRSSNAATPPTTEFAAVADKTRKDSRQEMTVADGIGNVPEARVKVEKDVRAGKKSKSNESEAEGKGKDANEVTSDSTQTTRSAKKTDTKSKASQKKKMMVKKERVSTTGETPDATEEWLKIQSKTTLRLKHNSKEKTELLGKTKKKIVNSTKAEEVKETTAESQNGNRRSLRLRSIQGSDESTGLPDETVLVGPVAMDQADEAEEPASGSVKSSTPTPDGNTTVATPLKSKKGQPGNLEKRTGKESSSSLPMTNGTTTTSDPVRRSSRSASLRQSISLEQPFDETPEKPVVDEAPAKPPVVLRKSSRTGAAPDIVVPADLPETKKPVSVAGNEPKKLDSPKENGSSVVGQAPGQSPTNGTRNFQSPKVTRRNEKLRLSDGSSESNRSSDLEEMPILAKVEPIRGKLNGKGEEEDIPILMPVVDEPRLRHEVKLPEKTEIDDETAVSFEIIKKRKKAAKEVAPLKIIKKVDGGFQRNNNGVQENGPVFKFEGSNGLDRDSKTANDSSKSKKKKKKKKKKKRVTTAPTLFEPEPKPLEEKTSKGVSVKKYFLGICPCEIDKGKTKEGHDDSGSDSEPLITLVNQSQSKGHLSEAQPEPEKLDLTESQTRETREDPKGAPAPVCAIEDVAVDVPERVTDITVPDKSDAVTVVEPKKKSHSRTKSKKKGKASKGSQRPVTPCQTVAPEQPMVAPEPDPDPVAKSEKTVPTEVDVADGISPEDTAKESHLPERRSRRISKETKPATNEFVIDDPLILVDELWSDLDSDSDGSLKKKAKKGKKRSTRKKFADGKKTPEVNLEELLRNFGENKEVPGGKETRDSDEPRVKVFGTVRLWERTFSSTVDIRKRLESRVVQSSYRRLSLKLFRFSKRITNFGHCGGRLSQAKKLVREKLDRIESAGAALPDLPFLTAEIKENPVQVIQCRSQKSKSGKTKGSRKSTESRSGHGNIRLKISLPLESINNMTVFNNNHLTELDVEKQVGHILRDMHADEKRPEEDKAPGPESGVEKENVGVAEEPTDTSEVKNKPKRSEVIDKIFYCEICKTYYYSFSQLRIHKLSNRHKLKESEMMLATAETAAMTTTRTEEGAKEVKEPNVEVQVREPQSKPVPEPVPTETQSTEETTAQLSPTSQQQQQEQQPAAPPPPPSSSSVETVESDKLNDDTSEMPVLEGPFIENPLTRVEPEVLEPQVPAPVPAPPPPPNSFGFTQESLKDIQRAIGCTDEEMLILTLLGENTIEIENDILDLDTGKSTRPKTGGSPSDKVGKSEGSVDAGPNGSIKVDLKQRMTSALACLVNKAVFNLLQKYESVAKSSVNPEAVSLLGKLSTLSRRSNMLQMNELLKSQKDGESSVSAVPVKEPEKKEPTVSYKYQCSICGSRFEKASTRECHISRSHKGKAKKFTDEVQQSPGEEWTDYWNYDGGDEALSGSRNVSQFWCSDCGINFVSPQEVHEHQKLEHQAGVKEAKDAAGPLQSSTIGSSDEIIEGKKTRRRGKVFSTEELDQQRIIANNELRKLDRKFSGKNSKANKIKWGMDALRFTVEKESKSGVDEVGTGVGVGVGSGVVDDVGKGPETGRGTDGEKSQTGHDFKTNIDLVPKLNFTRTSNIPEFKVIQKSSLKNRFQKIIDNKLKRKSGRHIPQETETEDVETEVMLVPVVVKKKSKRGKAAKGKKAGDPGGEKSFDVYDFNDSEPETEPVMLSHIKKPAPTIPATKLKLVKVKERPSKNKADSTTKDLVPDDYDSEDSLPLSIVKKSKPGDEDDDKDEKASEDSVEKSDGILEQVEYLIEQLENETGSADKKDYVKDGPEKSSDEKPEEKDEVEKGLEAGRPSVGGKEDTEGDEESSTSLRESLRVSLESKMLELPDLPLKNSNLFKSDGLTDNSNEAEENERDDSVTERILAEPESSHSTFDEEDSMPLVLMTKRTDESRLPDEDQKKCEDNTMDVSSTASEDIRLFKVTVDSKTSPLSDSRDGPAEESFLSTFPSQADKPPSKPFELLNGNVIYCRNESMSDFDDDSDVSRHGLIDSNYDKLNGDDSNAGFAKETVTEQEDVVIVCSKSEKETTPVEKGKIGRRKVRVSQPRRKDTSRGPKQRRKKRFPLLTATIEDNSFRRADNSKLDKEVIVRKIWSRRTVDEGFSADHDENSFPTVAGHDDDGGDDSRDPGQNDESQTEIEKEIIVKKIWSRKKVDYGLDKAEEKADDVIINKTEVSDEVVIKCGPKTSSSPKRRKSRASTNESSKETIMRKIWSGKCKFQTKAALKTYESDVMLDCKGNDGDIVVAPVADGTAGGQSKPRKRGRPTGLSGSKRVKSGKIDDDENASDDDDDDDLDSLLEEIEREQLEKAIRLEFLQLRRSEKANVEIMKECPGQTMGLFAETVAKDRRGDGPDRKRKKVRRNVARHPRQSLLKRKKFIKKPVRRVTCPPAEDRYPKEVGDPDPRPTDGAVDSVRDPGPGPGPDSAKVKNRKHKKHRHKHHHHKHKHKKSKRRKGADEAGKRRIRYESDGSRDLEADNGTAGEGSLDVPEKICRDDDDDSLDPSPPPAKTEAGNGNVYEFAEDPSDVSMDGYASLKA